MKIGINCQHITLTPTGPVYHLIELVKALTKLDTQNEFILYFQEKPTQQFVNMLVGNNPKIKIKVLTGRFSWTQILLARELMKNPVNLFFTSVHTLPLFISSNTKVIAMIHGLEYKKNKQYDKAPHLLLLHPLLLWVLFTRSKFVVTPSEATKSELIKTLPFINTEKIRIIKEGVNSLFYKRDLTEIGLVKTKYGLDKNYIYYISTIQPRKNIPRMIEGFSKAVVANPELFTNTDLVIAGGNGWGIEESLEAPQKFGIKDKVMFLGHVDGIDRPALLSGAQFYLNCSLEEGFSLTLLEALACKTPALVSLIPAHTELGQNYVRYLDPLNTDSIKMELLKMASNPIDDTLLEEGQKYAKEFSWDEAAKEFLKLFVE